MVDQSVANASNQEGATSTRDPMWFHLKEWTQRAPGAQRASEKGRPRTWSGQVENTQQNTGHIRGTPKALVLSINGWGSGVGGRGVKAEKKAVSSAYLSGGFYCAHFFLERVNE